MIAMAAKGGVQAAAPRRWLQRLVIGVILLSIAAVAVLGSMSLVHGPSEPKRQMAHIMILPDAPPPPPPPQDKKPPPPKEEQALQPVNAPVPKVDTPPEPAPLKMEGAAGEGNSMFAAGEVKQDYIGGDIGNGSRYAAYVARLEQRVQAELTRRKLHVANVKLFLWLSPDGAVQRYTVKGGDEDASRSVREALAELTRVDEAPLADMPMPVGLSIN
jgi:periplasmic protein TonB